jgi:hypothetical protein
MELRFYIDSETGLPHFYRHHVTEAEVEAVLDQPFEDRAAAEGARVAIGRTSGGRYLRVVYVPDPVPGSMFVITAYDLKAKAKRALQRRRRKKS